MRGFLLKKINRTESKATKYLKVIEILIKKINDCVETFKTMFGI
jgi:hypothetical protein